MKFLLTVLTILTSLGFAEWHIEAVDSTGHVGYHTSLALDSSGFPHISYVADGGQTVKYTYWDNSTWQVDTLIDITGGDFYIINTSLALSSSGEPHISLTIADLYLSWIVYSYWDGSDWQIEEPAGSYSSNSSLELDSSDYPRLSYTSTHLEYASWDGSNWQNEIVDPVSNVLTTTSLELDSSEYPHISYYDIVDDDLLYACWDGSAWQTETIDSVGQVGQCSSLRLDLAQHPHIAYNADTNGDLKYAYWNGSDWHIETVDSVGTVGWWVSLDLDSSGYPHISYYDCTNEDLKYAFWDGSVWNLEIVDSSGSVGRYTSLELDSQGNPHITYYDETNQDLKYAYGFETGIEGPIGNEDFFLHPICPNPASGTINVSFTTSESATVDLYVYDVSGKLVRESLAVVYSAGVNQVSFSGLTTGLHLCQMVSEGFTATQRFIVIE